MQGFRRCVEILAHDAVRAMTTLTFPVKFNDRLRRLNRITPANKIKSAAIAALIDAVPPLAAPIFATLRRPPRRSRRVWSRTMRRWPITSAKMSPARSIRSAPAAWAPPDDRDAVTDPAGRVHGIADLRVIDASIMPTIPRGNTNIPTIMVAEKLADRMLRRNARLNRLAR